MENRIKTVLLLAGMTAFLIVIGKLLGGRTGMYLAFVLAVGMNFFSYWFSDKIVLKMYGAQEVTPADAPQLHQIVAELAQEAAVQKVAAAALALGLKVSPAFPSTLKGPKGNQEYFLHVIRPEAAADSLDKPPY